MNNIDYTPIQIYQMRLSDEILRFPKGFWNIESANIIIRFLIEEVLKCNDIDITYHKFTKEFLKKYKLGGMVQILFKNSAREAIKSTYPDGVIMGKDQIKKDIVLHSLLHEGSSSIQEYGVNIKVCRSCGEKYPATPEHFVTDNSIKSGIGSKCRKCDKKRGKKYYNKLL